MLDHPSFSSLHIKPTWVGAFIEDHIQMEVTCSCGNCWCDCYYLGNRRWELVLTTKEDEYITSTFCSTIELQGLIMYVQVNKSYDSYEDNDVIYEGEVYDRDNHKICDFKWSYLQGTLWTNPNVERTNIDYFIDERCSDIFEEETGGMHEE